MRLNFYNTCSLSIIFAASTVAVNLRDSAALSADSYMEENLYGLAQTYGDAFAEADLEFDPVNSRLLDGVDNADFNRNSMAMMGQAMQP